MNRTGQRVAYSSAEGPSTTPGTQRAQQLLDAALAHAPAAVFAAASGVVLMTLHLDRGQIQLKADVAQVKAELKADVAQLKTDQALLRADLKVELAEVKAELKADLSQVKADLADVKAELKADLTELRFVVMDKLSSLERSLQDGQVKRRR
jgi:hypothetical protein